MRNIIIVLSCLAVTFFIFYYFYRVSANDLPKLYWAHGALFEEGRIVRPDADDVTNFQNRLITIYLDSLSREAQRNADEIRTTIYNKVDDEVLANALYLDWFIQDLNKKRTSILYTTNRSLRLYYTSSLQSEPVQHEPGETWSKGIENNIKDSLIATGLKVFDESVSSPQTYINNCISQGVPIPEQVFDTEWESLGILEDQIVFGDSESELRIYLSEEPAGFCLSLTRHNFDGDLDHLDMICLGTETNNACFFENADPGIYAEEDRHITEVQAGENTGVPCTLCHIGENPFIVHPGDPAFISAAEKKIEFFEEATLPNLNGTDMFTAINVPSWPINPPPFDVLKQAGTDASQCTTCHNSLNAGRFPYLEQMNNDYPDDFYCGSVLKPTIYGNEQFNANMPFQDLDNLHNYEAQLFYLERGCSDSISPDGIFTEN